MSKKPTLYNFNFTREQIGELIIALGHHRARVAAPKPSLNYDGALEVIDSILPELDKVYHESD